MKYASSWEEYLLFLVMFALSHSFPHSIPVLYFYFSLFICHSKHWCFLTLRKGSGNDDSKLCTYWKNKRNIWLLWGKSSNHLWPPSYKKSPGSIFYYSLSHRNWSGASVMKFKQLFWKREAFHVLSRGSDLVPTAMSECRPIRLALSCKQFSGSTHSSAGQNELRKRFWQVLLD